MVSPNCQNGDYLHLSVPTRYICFSGNAWPMISFLKKVNVDSIVSKLKSLAISLGADLVGVTTKEIMGEGPPSADPCYLLPTANSVISFAISLAFS